MTQTAPNQTDFTPREFRLADDLSSYVLELTRRAPGTILFRTGAGRILRDLLIHWPTLDDWENEAQEICEKITEAVYPLASALFAQAVEMTIVISPSLIPQPTSINAMATYIAFDAVNKIERHSFLSPHNALQVDHFLRVAKGIAVICRPINYRYHTLKDDRQRKGHPRAGIFEWPERLINAMLYEQPPFIAREKQILAMMKAEIKHLPKKITQGEMAQRVTSTPRQIAAPRKELPSLTATPKAPTSLSLLPPPVRALEQKLMAHVMDKTLSTKLRLGLRKVAQNIRTHYPQALIREAAHAQTAAKFFYAPLPAAYLATPLPQTERVLAQKIVLQPAAAQIKAPLPRNMPAPPLKTTMAPAGPSAQPLIRNFESAARTEALPAYRQDIARAEAKPTPVQTPHRETAPQKPAPDRAREQPKKEERKTESPEEKPAAKKQEKPETRPASQPQPSRTSEAKPARYPHKDPEMRPAGFYDRLQRETPKQAISKGLQQMPKSTPVANVGKLSKSLPPKPAPLAIPIKPPQFRTAQPLRLWAGLLSSSPSPLPRGFNRKG